MKQSTISVSFAWSGSDFLGSLQSNLPKRAAKSTGQHTGACKVLHYEFYANTQIDNCYRLAQPVLHATVLTLVTFNTSFTFRRS